MIKYMRMVIISLLMAFIMLINSVGASVDITGDVQSISGDGSVAGGTGKGVSSLMLHRGNEEIDSSLIAEYSYSTPGGSEYFIDLDFSYSEGGVFQVRNWNGTSWHACFIIEDDYLKHYINGSWRKICSVTPEKIHTLRYAVTSGKTLDIYLDGEQVAENVSKPNGKTNLFSVYMTGKNTTVNIYRLALIADSGSFNAAFRDENAESLEKKGWTFPDMSAYSDTYADVVCTADGGMLTFEAGERAQACVVTDANYSMNGQPARVTFTFTYEEGAAMQIRILNGSGSWLAAFHLSNNTLTHQADSHIRIGENLTPGQEYTLMMSCDTLAANSVDVYLNGTLVSENKAYTSGSYIAPKYVQILNLSDAADINIRKFEASTDSYFTNDYLSKGFAPVSEDYSKAGTTAKSWTEIENSAGMPEISFDSTNKYMYITRTEEGTDGSFSCTLPENINCPLSIETEFSVCGYGTNIISVGDVSVKIEDGRINGRDIEFYKKYKLVFYITASTAGVYLDNENILTVHSAAYADTITFTNTAQKAGSKLFSELCIYGIDTQYGNSPVISVTSAELRAVSDGRKVTSVQEEPVICEAELKNSGESGAVYITVAVYKDESLYDIMAESIFIKSGDSTVYTVQIPAYSNAAELSVKLFIWDSDYKPIISADALSELISSERFERFKCYFSQTGFEMWDDEYEFSPACGTVDINLTLDRAVDISVYGSERVEVFTVSAASYSAFVSEGSQVTVFADTDKDGYDIYVDGRKVFGTKAFSTATDNIASLIISQPEAVSDINIMFSDRELSEKPVDTYNPVYNYEFDGGLPEDWTYFTSKSGTVTAGSGYMTMKKTATGSGTKTGIMYTLEKSVGGTAELNVRFRTRNTTSNSEYRFYINMSNNRAQIWTRIYGGKLYYTDVNGTEHCISGKISDNTWHTLKIVDYTSRSAMDIYIDGKLVAEEISGRSRYFSAVDEIQFYTSDSCVGNIDVDFMKISTHIYDKPEGYSEYTSAPELKNLIAPEDPTGTVYYGADGDLKNYGIISDPAAFGGKAVKVTEPGAGRITFVFKGSSGYRKINAGYLESGDAVDSSFRIFANGKEIDFWYGKYDDGGRHVRNVSDGMYVRNGDVFVVEGYSTGDGSIFNYLEFTEAEDKLYDKGVFIDDEYWKSDTHRPTSWDINSRDIKIATYNGSKVMEFKDESSSATLYAARNLKKIAGDRVVLDLIFDSDIESGKAEIRLKSGNQTAAVITAEPDGVYYTDDGEQVKITSASGWKGIRLILDTVNRTYSIVNGADKISGLMLEANAGYVDKLEIETGAETVGSVYMKMIALSSGYLCNDDFKVYTRSVLPEGWSREISGGSVYVAEAGGEMTDTRALRISDTSSSAGVAAVRAFPKTQEELTVSFNILTGDGINIKIGDGISVYTENGNLYCNSGMVWENYRSDVWYRISAEADYAAKKADIYVNNIKKATVDITDVSAETLRFETAAKATLTCYVDDVVIENSVYKSPVEEPKPVKTGNYDIAVQACDLWREGQHFGWDAIRPYDYTTPVGGYYDDGSRQRADMEIKWMAEHGISVYMPCWYRSATKTKTTLYGDKWDAFLSSPYIDDIKFALIYETSGGVTSADDFMNNILPYWMERYFKHPSYYTVDNKPVIAIWGAEKLRNGVGGTVEANAALFERIEQKLIEEGFAGAIFMTNTSGSGYVSKTLADSGYDYTYVYSFGNRSVEEQIDNQLSQTQYGYMDAVASLSQGWGSEPWGRGERKGNMPLSEWYGALNYFKNEYMSARDADSLASRLVMLDNWNEWGEGHAICPSNIAGFGYLDAVRYIFGDGNNVHEEYTAECDNNLYVH